MTGLSKPGGPGLNPTTATPAARCANQTISEKEAAKRLPKMIMRPYLCYLPYHVDDHTFVAYEASEPISFALAEMISGVIIVVGLAFLFGAIGLLALDGIRELWAFFWGIPLFLTGGVSSIWLWHKGVYENRTGKYHIFDREKGILRTTILENGRRRVKAFPFEECYAELGSMNTPTIPLAQNLVCIRHPSYAGMLHLERFNSLDAALGHWSFIVQYMDNQAPLPNVGWLTGYPNRTDGVGPADKWEEKQKKPGFIDPYDCRFDRDQDTPIPGQPPRRFAPRAQVRVDAPGSAGGARPHTLVPGGRLPLPKKLLRPYVFETPTAADADRYCCERRPEKGRYYDMILWTVLCAGLGLLPLGWAVGLPFILLAGLAYGGLRYVKRIRGAILDRENGNLILHKGWLLRPLALPFDQCQGLLITEAHPMGFATSRLFVEHPQLGLHTVTDDNSPALDKELGLWSFFVQYMDKTRPLPKTGPFENLPDADPGLGDWEDWSTKTTQSGFVDPFAQWLKALAEKGEPEILKEVEPGVHYESPVHTDADPSGRQEGIPFKHKNQS